MIVERRYREDRPVVAEWRKLKHVALVSARLAGGDVEPTATPTATPAASQPAVTETQKAA